MNAPTSTAKALKNRAGQAAVEIERAPLPLKGTYGSLDCEASAEVSDPVPPPVRFAPLG